MRRLPAILLPLILFVGLALWWLTPEKAAHDVKGSESASSASTIPAPVLSPVGDPALEQWVKDHREAREIPAADMERAVALATERKARMLQWIATDPGQALEQAVTLAEYEALPEPLKPLYERPFVALATLRVLPVCAGDAPAEPMRILEMEGRSWEASVYGWRQRQVTKQGTPLAGITLDGVAAIAEHAFAPVAAEEVAAHASLPLGNPDASRDFSTGEALGDRPVTALAAGKRFLFANVSSLEEANQKMAALDDTVSPTRGSNVVFALPSPAEGGVDWEGATGEVELQASAWSETPKSVFCIRVDFSDVAGEVVSQAALASVMNTAVADTLEEMSYNKTTITAGVSSSTVRMPQPSTFYKPSKNTELHTDARNAYLAVAGATALNGYDIVVVHFPSIGMQGSGLTYAGLAGGDSQWLQGTHDSGVIIHEFGHNYGLGHSSFWQTSDGSVTGTGESVEYGDQTDIMGSGPDPEGHFHMQGKQRLGWFTAAQWQDATATGSGTRRIYRFDSVATTGALRGVRITKAASPEEYYWIGYRPGVSTQPSFQKGAYLIWQQPGQTRSWLVDTTPGTPDGKNDAAVALGRTFSDTTANVHVTPLAIGGTGADQWLDVNVQIGPFPGNTAPTATLTANGSAAARADVAFSATASDGNGDALAYHWDFGDGTTSANAAAVNHRWLVGGNYTVTLTVSDMKGGTVVKTQAVTVSDPLTTWTAGTVVAGRTLNRNAYLNGRFIATGNQYVYGSFDGLAWKEQYLALNFRSGGMAYGNGRYVIAGYDFINNEWRGVVFHSTDGIKWTQASLAALPELHDVAWGGGAFVAVGTGGTILRSTNGGQSWSPMSAPGSQTLDGIAYGNGGFVAVGGTKVYTSPDGITWTDRSSGHSLASWHSFDSVEFTGGKFIAGGWYSGLHVSLDGGVTWTEVPIRGDHDYEVQNIIAGEGSVVASAVDKTDANAITLLVSSDGLSWEESSYTGFPATDALAFGNGRYATVSGSNGASSRSNGFYPSNAAPSASITAPATANARASVLFTSTASDANGDALILAWDFKDGTPLGAGPAINHVFSTGGSYSVDLTATDTRGGVTVTSHTITITDPLDTWTTRTSGTTANLNDIAFGGGKLVAVGESSGTYRVSTDGVNWPTGGSIALNGYFYGLIHDGSKFVAVGQDHDGSWKGTIFTSPDGTTWTRRHFAGSPLKDVAFGGGVYIASGDTGTLLRSTNGTTWSPVPSGVSVNINGVSYGNGGFVAVGAANNGGSGIVLTSPDGNTWTNTSAAAGLESWHGFYDVEYCNDRFLASGWYAKIRHSTNGGTSFATTQTDTRQIPAFAYGNGIYLAAGIDKGNGDADINLISTDGANWSPLATASQNNRRAVVFFDNTFITVGDGGTIRQSAAFTAPPVATGYNAWQALHFPGSPALSGTNDDFDGDGIANLAEYATGTDPKDSGSRAVITQTLQGGQLILTIPRDPAATDVLITGKRSTSLNNWTETGVTILENTATQFRASIPVNGSNGFLRAEFGVN